MYGVDTPRGPRALQTQRGGEEGSGRREWEGRGRGGEGRGGEVSKSGSGSGGE